MSPHLNVIHSSQQQKSWPEATFLPTTFRGRSHDIPVLSSVVDLPHTTEHITYNFCMLLFSPQPISWPTGEAELRKDLRSSRIRPCIGEIDNSSIPVVTPKQPSSEALPLNMKIVLTNKLKLKKKNN